MAEASQDEKKREKMILKGFLSGNEPMARIFFEEYGGIIQKAVSSVGIKDRSLTGKDLFMAAVENLLRDDKRPLRLFKGKCKLSTYIFTISRRCAIELAQREFPPGPDPDTVHVPEALADMPGEKENRLFNEALHHCTAKERIFIKMMFYYEYSTVELMDFFRWNSENTVYSRKNKIINKLKKIMKRLD